METLVEFPHADGTAGVYRDGGGLWLSGMLGDGATLLEGWRPSVEGLGGPRTAQGGRLPPGAIGAEVVDDLGERRAAAAAHGAWVIVLEQPTEGESSPVRFVDERGETVARPIPEGWRRAPVTDATDPCPACGAWAWDEVEPQDDSRGMHAPGTPAAQAALPPDLDLDWQPNPFVRCRACGFEEPAGTWFGAAGAGGADHSDREEAARLEREFRAECRRAAREALAEIDFRVFVPEGLEVEIAGWGGHPAVDRVTAVHSADREISVETMRGDAAYGTEAERALEALEDLLRDSPGDWPRASQPAMTVWLGARERENRRERRRLMAGVEAGQRRLRVDGGAQDFAFAEVADRWAAVGRTGDLGLVVSARGIEPEEVRLVGVANPP